MKQIIDEQLIEQAGRGDSAAFSEIYFALRGPVFGFAYRMLGEVGAAEDVAHDVFIFFIENPQKYQPARGTLLSFLCGVTRNLIMHHLRKSRSQTDLPHDEDEDFIDLKDETALNPLRVLLAEELAKKVEEEVSALSPLLREVVLLREMQEFSYGEIAEITGADISAVKVRLHRARKILAARLAPYLKEEIKDKVMNCAEAKQILNLFIDGELEPAQKERIARHLPNCSACQHELARLQMTGTLLKKHLPIAAPMQLDARILAAFQKHHQKPAPSEKKRRFFGSLFGKILIPIPVFALVLAVFAIGVGAAYQLGRSSVANIQIIASETKNSEVKSETPAQTAQSTAAQAPFVEYVKVPITKIVKIPVVREKTIIKYTEKKHNHVEKPSPINLENPEALTAMNKKPAQAQISLKDFQPVSVLKPRIIRKGEDQ